MTAPAVPLTPLFELAGQGSTVGHLTIAGRPLCGLSRSDLTPTLPRDRKGRDRDYWTCGACLEGVVRP